MQHHIQNPGSSVQTAQTTEQKTKEILNPTHSKIENYFCEKCGKGFTFNTPKRRHCKVIRIKYAYNHIDVRPTYNK